MSPFPVVTFLSVLTVAGQLLAIVLALALISCVLPAFTKWISDRGLLLMLIVALTATLGSLFFSEVAGWTPCKLCWLQRIFIYPQTLLLALALWKKDRKIAPYVLVLCVFGAVFAAFHYGEQVMAALNPPPDSLKPCDATGVSCAKTPFFTFGYITIPMMALTACILNGLGSVAMLRGKQH